MLVFVKPTFLMLSPQFLLLMYKSPWILCAGMGDLIRDMSSRRRFREWPQDVYLGLDTSATTSCWIVSNSFYVGGSNCGENAQRPFKILRGSAAVDTRELLPSQIEATGWSLPNFHEAKSTRYPPTTFLCHWNGSSHDTFIDCLGRYD